MGNDKPLIGSAVGRLIVVACCLAALWVSLAITIASMTATTEPEAALRAWPWSSAARATLAARSVDKGEILARPEAAKIAQLASAASRRSVVNVTAARAYAAAMFYMSRPVAGRAAINFSEHLSRRDLATQLLLIEDAVSRGEIATALIHYDRALRVSAAAEDILFPILISAADEKSIRDALAARLTLRPHWWAAFISRAIGQASSAETLMPLVDALRLDVRDPSHALIAGAILDRLVSWQRLDDAWRLQRQYWPARARDPRVANGGFEEDNGFGPFAWRLASEDDFSASIEARDSGRSLFVSSQSRSGEVARQIVRIPQGTGVLSARAGGLGEGEQFVFALRCLTTGVALVEQRVAPEATAEDKVYSFPLAGVSSCPYGMLTISYQAGQNSGNAWVDDVVIDRAGR